MASLFLALLLFPEVQERAQAERDSVIERDRLPTYDDKPRLPYIQAMIKELLRWHAVSPLYIDETSIAVSCLPFAMSVTRSFELIALGASVPVMTTCQA